MKKRIISSAVALGAALAVVAGGVAMAAPGPGNINPDAKGSITLTKYEGAPGDTDAPLADVKFTLYKVTGLDVTNSADWPKITELNEWFVEQGEAGSWTAGNTVGADSGYSYTTVSEQTTGTEGVASWGVGTPSTLDLGVYFIQETGAPANVAEHTLPFLVTVPLAKSADNTWIYDVNVYPKNAVVDIEKAAVDAGHVGVGSNIEWVVTNEIPTTQRDFDDYKLRDVLDSRLDYVANSSTVAVGGVALEADDFTVADTSGTLLLTINPTGRAKLDDAQGEDLVWTFKTTVKTIGDGVIKNGASVMVNKPTGTWDDDGVDSNVVTSNWGAIKINKFEDKDTKKALSGAIFQVFGTEEAASTCKAAVAAADGTLTAGCANAISVYRDAAGTEISAGQNQFTTDENGTVTIPGVHVGINANTSRGYWLVEIVPPAGFINANAVYPVTATVGGVTETGAQGEEGYVPGPVTKDVANAQEPPTTLPMTGAQVRMIMIVAAALLGAGAIALVVVNRRKAARNA